MSTPKQSFCSRNHLGRIRQIALIGRKAFDKKMGINDAKRSLQFLKKNKIFDAAARIILYPAFLLQYKQSDRTLKKRKAGYKDESFLWIKNLKNTHEGERCFVVATGPSLTMEDLEMIKGEYSFGMNSVIQAFDKTEWRPNFYMIQDEYVYGELENELKRRLEREKFLVAVGGPIPEKYPSAKQYKPFALHYLDHKMFHRSGFGEFRFSDNCYNTIYDGYTVTFSVLQMACYMGFKEIYLLGCDCNYNLPKLHFVDYGYRDPKASIMGDKMICGHSEFKKFADAKGIKVINCTRGGMLEVYPRMNLEAVLR